METEPSREATSGLDGKPRTYVTAMSGDDD